MPSHLPAASSPRAPGPHPALAASRAWSDEVLASRAASGDRASFAELIDRYQARIYRFALVRLRNTDDAADVAQEVFCRVWRGLGRFDPTRSFATWILTIARREIVDVARDRRRRTRDTLRERERLAAAPPPPADLPDAWGLARRTLDDRAFEALWLCYAEDRTPAQIARMTGRTPVAVRVQLHRARRALAQAMATDAAAHHSPQAQANGPEGHHDPTEAAYGAA